MNVLVTTERRIRNSKIQKSYQRFQRALAAAATGEPIDFRPAGHAEDRKLRVLIVDDHRANADTMSSLVAKWGHDVRRAYDGVTGLALAAAYRPDVLLLDILMPGMSGIEVATQVRRQDRFKNCFIIAVTGRTDAKHRNRCYEVGMDLFLMKPVAPTNMQTLLSLELERVNRLNGIVTIADTYSEFTTTY